MKITETISSKKKEVQDLINENVSLMGENIIIRRFARYELGEESAADSEAEVD